MKRYLLIRNIGRLVTMTGDVITDAACLLRHGRIEWLGKETDVPALEEYQYESIDADGGVVMPGLIDCHTHIVHGGSRQDEFAERSRGKTYEEIARAGGGILSTVAATRRTSFEELCKRALALADDALQKGITTMEVKSGYGLDSENEIKMLKVVKWLHENHPITFIPTFLGAHAIPPEFKDSRERFVDIIVNEMIPRVAEERLAVFCDVFVERIAFTAAEARKIVEAGRNHGLLPKLHVDQLTPGGGAELAAEVGAVSADHLEYASSEGIKMMASAGVTAVILPGSTFYLGRNDFVSGRRLIDAGLNVAIATDYNPGTTPSLDIFLACTMAVAYSEMTIEEAIRGITVNAAKALNIEDSRGTLVKDGIADIIILDAPDECWPIYRYGSNHVRHVIKDGKIRYSR